MDALKGPLPPSLPPVPRSFLHDLFSQFDRLALMYGVHKIETVG